MNRPNNSLLFCPAQRGAFYGLREGTGTVQPQRTRVVPWPNLKNEWRLSIHAAFSEIGLVGFGGVGRSRMRIQRAALSSAGRTASKPCSSSHTAGERAQAGGRRSQAVIGFDHVAGELCAESVALADIAARYGTPTYVYSRKALTQALRAFQDGCAGRRALICYAVKANSNIAIIDLFARLGAGFDIVSGGELERVLAVGADPAKIVFSGVGKTETEMVQGLDANILCFNVESGAELERLARVAAERGKSARVSLRVNPDVDAKTHPYIATGLKENKFGVPYDEALRLYRWAARQASLAVVGIDCHIGSQLTEVDPFLEALDKILYSGANSRMRVCTSNTSTWAAGWVSVTETRSRQRWVTTCALCSRVCRRL